MLLGLQLVGVLFALFMLYLTFLHKKRNEFTATESGFWTLMWVIFTLLVLFPHSVDFVIKGVLNFDRTMDFFIVAGFMFVIGSIFYTYTVLRRTQKKVETIVQKIAIDNAYKSKK
jgi:hypothetical protein